MGKERPEPRIIDAAFVVVSPPREPPPPPPQTAGKVFKAWLRLVLAMLGLPGLGLG
jgi:hypothetical protein